MTFAFILLRDFVLVDDYWIAFAANHYFDRQLRKVSTSDRPQNAVLTRADDSDEVGLALYTQPKVKEARRKLYIHHMLQGWPKFDRSVDTAEVTRLRKKNAWGAAGRSSVGFNVHAGITDEEIELLASMGVSAVRLGIVGSKGPLCMTDFYSFLVSPPSEAKARLDSLLGRFERHGVDVVIALHHRLAVDTVWQSISEVCAQKANVIGYDLINEPFDEIEDDNHWSELEPMKSEACTKYLSNYQRLISSVRAVDKATPIVIEPPYWGRAYRLHELMNAMFPDDNIVFSVHFYEPRPYMGRKGKSVQYPGRVPIYESATYSEDVLWNKEKVEERIGYIANWAKTTGSAVFIGEAGICRDIPGAADYLADVLEGCKNHDLPVFLYAFRIPTGRP